MTRVRVYNPPPARRGFSFVEVMFAVVILGIGLIMVAALFPVAISQNQATGEANSSATFTRVSASLMQQLCNYNAGVYGYAVGASQSSPALAPAPNPTYVFPIDCNVTFVPGTPATYPHGSYAAVGGGLISSADPRFAVVPLYSLSTNGTSAQFYFFNVTSRNTPIYDPTKDVYPYATFPNSNPAATPNPSPAPSPAYYQSTLTPKLLKAAIVGGTPSLITFQDGTHFKTSATDPLSDDAPTWKQATWTGIAAEPYYTPNATLAVGMGCFVLIGSDNGNVVDNAPTPAIVPNTTGTYNGKVYRVGNQRLDLDVSGNTYEMAPGWDFVPKQVSATQLINGIGTVTVNPATQARTINTFADVWIVGKGLQTHTAEYAPPTAATPNGYTDAVQDVSFYTTFAPIR